MLDFLQRLHGGEFREMLHATAARLGIDRVERARSADRHPGHIQAPPKTPAPPCDPLDAALLVQLTAWQAALPSSPAATYLSARTIPTDIAIGTGIGYAVTAWPGKRLAGTPLLVFPLTDASGQVLKKAKKPKKPKIVGGGGKKTLGKWLESADEPSAPPVKAVRKVPSFNTGPKKKK